MEQLYPVHHGIAKEESLYYLWQPKNIFFIRNIFKTNTKQINKHNKTKMKKFINTKLEKSAKKKKKESADFNINK